MSSSSLNVSSLNGLDDDLSSLCHHFRGQVEVANMVGAASVGVSLFRDFTLAIRMAIAHLREDQDEYLLNLSAPMVGDSVDVVLVIKGFGSFLASGSSALNKINQ